MDTEIYYFSGTGNSLHIAKELQKRIPGSSTIPIVKLLQQDKINTLGKAIGIVFPVHALTIPIAVKRFLKKADMHQAEYIFAIATRYGTVFAGFDKIDKILKRKNKRLDAHFILNMFHNDCREKGFKVPTKTDISNLESTLQERLDTIQKIIAGREPSREEDNEFTLDVGPLLEKAVIAGMDISEHIGGVNYFCADDKCSGCGICEKVCLSQKINMQGERPVWQKKTLCYMCFACVNFCPRQSVQINDLHIPVVKSFTRENGRYPHPFVSAEDIARQK